MAYTTTQTLDNLLLRGLNFRTPANAAISSQYTLYANGSGQTYWSNSVSPSDLSTLSTVFTSSLQYQSTVTGNIFGIYNSTAVGFSNAAITNGLRITALSTSMDVSLSNVYSTLYGEINGISSISTFYNELSAVQSSVNAGLSSLSTVLDIQNTSTYSTLTVNYLAADNCLWNSTLSTIGDQLSSLSSVVAYESDLSSLSTTLTQQLFSTTTGTLAYTDIQIGDVNSTISTIYYSSIVPIQSTSIGLAEIIQPFADLSTNLSSITGDWISTSIGVNNIPVYSTIYGVNDSLTLGISTLAQSTLDLTISYSTFSTNYIGDYSTIFGLNVLNSTYIQNLQYQFDVITTSSILASIYSSFIDLEYYTSTLVGSTNASFVAFEAELVSTTTSQNISSSSAFFIAFNDSIYTSSVSSVTPSTIEYVSSLVSTLYSTSYTFLISSLNSTIFELTDDYNSTISSYTYIYISTVEDNYNSSVLQYLSAPAGEMLSTYSSLNYFALSTFQSTSEGQLADQSTLFYSSFLLWDSSITELTSTASSLIYIQSSVIASTLIGYPSTLTYYLNSTNTYVLQYTTVQANNTLLLIENSTTTTYNQFVTDLQAASSTAALSSIYTFNNMDLSGTTSTVTMDLASYRNFYITIYDITDGIPYIVNYIKNTISALDYRTGLITINVSTVGSPYTYNGGRLRLDVNRWGMPTTTNGNIIPYISSAAYTVQYMYNIINSVVYTNLLNIYPVLAIQNPYMDPTTVLNVYVSSLGIYSPTAFWRGSPVVVSWTNYTFYPYLSTLDANVDILVDVVVAGSTITSYGPYPFSQSTATVYAPYLTNQQYPVIPTRVEIYVAGLEAQAAALTFSTIIPGFDNLTLTPFGYPGDPNPPTFGFGPNWIGGTELVALTDNQAVPLYGMTPNVITNNVLYIPTYSYYNNNPLYVPSNLLDGVYNTVGMYSMAVAITNVNYGSITGAYQFYDDTAMMGHLSLRFSMPGDYLPLLTYLIQAVSINITIYNTILVAVYNGVITGVVDNGDGTFTLENTGSPSQLFDNNGESYTIRVFVNTTPINDPDQVMATLTSIGYTPSTFVGPRGDLGTGPPYATLADELAYADIPSLLTSNALFSNTNIDSVSTLVYYNFSSLSLGNTPNDIYNSIDSNATGGMAINGSVYYQGEAFMSTFIITNSSQAQIFRM
jgi:hypothetical protein